MRAFIERVFKSKKQKQKEILDEITHTEVKEQATEAAVEAIIEEVKKEEVVTYPKPNHFPDCNCFKCGRWKQQNAK
jgi:hypothetical protein